MGNAGLVRFFRSRGSVCAVKCCEMHGVSKYGKGGKHDLRFREIGRVGTTPGFNILLGNHNETPRR